MPWESIPRLSDSMSTCQRGKEREHSTIQRWKVGCNPRNREQECEREHTVQPFVRPCSPKIQTLWAGEVPPAAHERGWPTNNRGQGHTAALLPDPSYPPPPPSFSLHSSRPRPQSGAPPTHLGSCHSLLVRHAILHKYVLHKALEEVKVHPSVRHGRGGGLGLGTRRRRRRLHPVHRRPHRHHRVIGGPTCSRPAGHQARVLLLGRRRRRAAAGQDRGRRRTERRERVLAGRRHRGHGRGGGGGGRHGRKKRVGREGRSAGETEARWRNSVLRWGQRVRNTTTERGGNLAEEGRRSRERQDVVVTPEERWIKAGRSSQAARVAGEDTAMRCERKGGQLHQSGQRGCVSADCAGRQPTASWGRVWAGRSPLVPSHDPVDAACRIRLGRPGPGSTARQVFHASFLQQSSSQLDAVLISIYLAAKKATFNYVHTVTHIHKGQ